tara:strand:- start:1158 stop:1373 length:216 start_codon:yes stop_codon:yes gene_type:complete
MNPEMINKLNGQREAEEDMFAVDLHNELLAFVRKFASRNEYGQFVNRNMDVSGYDKLADICEEAENILKSN